VQRTAVGPERAAAVDVDLRARPARSHVAHLPEVVLVAEPLDAIHRHAYHLVPDLLGFVVALVHRDPQPVAVETEHFGDEFPAPWDGFFFEVVAETEVAEHLEKDEVTLRASDVVEVVVLAAGAHALLHADGTVVRRGLFADEVRLERHHARHREHERRIERNQARRRHHRVLAIGEEADEGLSQAVGRRDVGARHAAIRRGRRSSSRACRSSHHRPCQKPCLSRPSHGRRGRQ